MIKSKIMEVSIEISRLTEILLKPTHYPSPPSQRHLPFRSSLLPQSPGDAWRAGSCRRHGCREWSTCPAGGVGPGDSTQRAPRPEEGWAAGSPPPAEPRSWCHPAGQSSTEMFHVAGPEEEDMEEDMGKGTKKHEQLSHSCKKFKSSSRKIRKTLANSVRSLKKYSGGRIFCFWFTDHLLPLHIGEFTNIVSP